MYVKVCYDLSHFYTQYEVLIQKNSSFCDALDF